MENVNGNKTGASANGHRYVFDEFEIDPANRTCLRGGNEVPLTGRVFDILLVFAENPGRLLKKDELIDKVWHGEFVEDSNLTRNVSTLRRALGDDSKGHKYIATVQGHGYRFIASVSEVKVNNDSEVAEQTSWAVLPLKSLDAGENYLGAGIADAVIRSISQTNQLTVRPTSAILKLGREDTDSLAAARQLNVDAILEGSVQRVGDRLRVGVNLLRTSDGASLWADNFDMTASDIFVIEDKVAQRNLDNSHSQGSELFQIT